MEIIYAVEVEVFEMVNHQDKPQTWMQGLEIPVLFPNFTLRKYGEIWDKHRNFQPLHGCEFSKK